MGRGHAEDLVVRVAKVGTVIVADALRVATAVVAAEVVATTDLLAVALQAVQIIGDLGQAAVDPAAAAFITGALLQVTTLETQVLDPAVDTAQATVVVAVAPVIVAVTLCTCRVRDRGPGWPARW